MLYRIKLQITYAYDRPVARGRHLICVVPQSIPGRQSVRNSHLSIQPHPDDRRDRYDHFGNAVTEIGLHQPHSKITVHMETEVERHALPLRDTSPPLDQLPGSLDKSREVLDTAPWSFVTPSPRVANDPVIAGFARAQVLPGMSTYDAVIAVGQALYGVMTFDPTTTQVDTPPHVAFEAKSGVCQDYAHIMICALRALGVPCAYVSGYLRTLPPPGMARLEGVDAMHAWIRAWCGPDMGWVAYDPTNRTLAGQDHVVAAMGRDYADVSPIKGVVLTSGGQRSQQMVDVAPITS